MKNEGMSPFLTGVGMEILQTYLSGPNGKKGDNERLKLYF